METRQHLLKLAEGYGNDAMRAGAEFLQASMALYIGDLPGARRRIDGGQALFERAWANDRKDRQRWVDAVLVDLSYRRGSLLLAEGKPVDAENYLRKGVAAVERNVVDNQDRLRTQIATVDQVVVEFSRCLMHAALAEALDAQSRFVEAEFEMRKAVTCELRSVGSQATFSAFMLGRLAQLFYRKGRYEDARRVAEAAVHIYEHNHSSPRTAALLTARRIHAASLAALQRWDEAQAGFDRLEQDFLSDPTLATQSWLGDLDWGLVLLHYGQVDKAVGMLKLYAEKTAQRVGKEHYDAAEARGFYAIALARDGQTAAAFEQFRAALAVLSRAAGEQQRSAVRVARLARIIDAYISLLYDLRGSAPLQQAGVDAVNESFSLADVARAGGVQQALASSTTRSLLGDNALKELVRREQDTRQQIVALEAAVVANVSLRPEQQSPDLVEDLRDRIERVRRAGRKLREEIVARYPAYAELLNPSVPSLDKARASLLDGEALISFFVGEQRSFVWAVPKTGPVQFAEVTLGERALAEEVAALRRALAPQARILGDIPEYDLEIAYRLYLQLLVPVKAGWVASKTLLIVPHKALAQLPLALLATEKATARPDERVLFDHYARVPWLIRSHALAQLPSVSALTVLRSPSSSPPSRRAFAGFGDPKFSLAQSDARPGQRTAAVDARTRNVVVRNLTVERVASSDLPDDLSVRVRNSSRLAQVPRLPETADEIREIAAVLGADPVADVFLEERASEAAVKAGALERRRVVVFATHGLVAGDLDGLDEPALALSAPEVTGEQQDDGLLTMSEILALRLEADWVVLSACNTAAAEGAGAEAVSGLGRAFFYAGTRSLLASSWPVETTSARTLTTQLFMRQREQPDLTRAQALRAAMIALIDSSGYVDPATKRPVFSYAHPIFWAPFILVGDAGK